MTNMVEFGPYNNWPNEFTWSAFTHITDNHLERVMVMKGVQHWLTFMMRGLFSMNTRDTFRELLMREWIGTVLDWMEWSMILEALRGPVPQVSNLDEIALAYFQTIPGVWQTIVSGIRSPLDQDLALKNWVRDGVITWVETPDARLKVNSPINILVNACFTIALASIDWQHLEEALKETI